MCSRCGAASAKIHSYHHRTVADLPIDGRPVVGRVRFGGWSARRRCTAGPFVNRFLACSTLPAPHCPVRCGRS
ncbi:transposase family protein [Nocardia sp. NPDC004168]|uniref:transposase family protein n=1 Tax=Nocardia sp. NPDC004168 TaxID=3154452 RepID=UPI0033A73FCE